MLVTSREHPGEPLELHIGDSFLGFTLERVTAPFTSGVPTSITGHFSGERVVTGTLQSLSGCSTSPGIYAYIFWPDEPYWAAFPQFYPDFGETTMRFTFYDVAAISRALGLSDREIREIADETIRGVRVEQIQLRVGNLTVSTWVPTGHVEVLEVLSVGGLTVTRTVPGVYVLLVSVAALFAVGAGWSAWRYARGKPRGTGSDQVRC